MTTETETPVDTHAAGRQLLAVIRAELFLRGWRVYRVDTLRHPDLLDLELRQHYSGQTWELTATHYGRQGDGIRPVLDRRHWSWTVTQAQQWGEADQIHSQGLSIVDQLDRYRNARTET